MGGRVHNTVQSRGLIVPLTKQASSDIFLHNVKGRPISYVILPGAMGVMVSVCRSPMDSVREARQQLRWLGHSASGLLRE